MDEMVETHQRDGLKQGDERVNDAVYDDTTNALCCISVKPLGIIISATYVREH